MLPEKGSRRRRIRWSGGAILGMETTRLGCSPAPCLLRAHPRAATPTCFAARAPQSRNLCATCARSGGPISSQMEEVFVHPSSVCHNLSTAQVTQPFLVFLEKVGPGGARCMAAACRNGFSACGLANQETCPQSGNNAEGVHLHPVTGPRGGAFLCNNQHTHVRAHAHTHTHTVLRSRRRAPSCGM